MSNVEFRKDIFADERDDDFNEIGKPRIRQDILGHVTGRSRYYDDHLFDGLLHMRCVRSPHHHARIRSVDASAAERMPGVRRIVRPSDVPNNLNTLLSLIGFGRDDEPLIASGKVAYRGEPVLAIIAETEAQARAACNAVRVDWEVLPHVLDVEEAIKPGAPTVNETYPNNTFDYGRFDHQKLRFGDVRKAFREAAHVVEAEYQMSPIEQAPVETCGAIAAPETNDRYLCHTGTQALFFSLGTTAKLLDTPSSKLHFIGGTVGGGFGGKVDSLTEPMAVLGAMLTGRPVKFQWDREEEMQVGAPRGGERWRIRDAVTADGHIIGREFTGFFDSGAYTRLSSYAIQKGTGHLPGPYWIPNVASNIYCVFTNRTPATAMRGFGITGVDFAIECHMDRVAETVGIDPIELRILNSYRDGDMKPHRRLAKNCALVECCQVVAEKAKWPISQAARSASSLTGSSPERASIPDTAVDEEGKIGDRRNREIDPAPAPGTKTVPAGTRQPGEMKDAGPQRPDMMPDAAALGLKRDQASAQRQVRAAAPSAHGAPQPVAPAQVRPAAPAAAPPAAAAQPQPSAPAAPPAREPGPAPSTGQPAEVPYQPDKPFQRGVRRPGVSPFLSGSRRR